MREGALYQAGHLPFALRVGCCCVTQMWCLETGSLSTGTGLPSPPIPFVAVVDVMKHDQNRIRCKSLTSHEARTPAWVNRGWAVEEMHGNGKQVKQ